MDVITNLVAKGNSFSLEFSADCSSVRHRNLLHDPPEVHSGEKVW